MQAEPADLDLGTVKKGEKVEVWLSLCLLEAFQTLNSGVILKKKESAINLISGSPVI